MAQYTAFKGLIPLVDRRKVSEPFVIDGKNFYVDADGPVSGFGSTYIAPDVLVDATLIQDFKVLDKSFVFTKTGVMTYDYTASRFIPVFVFAAPLTTVAPWSMGQVGGYYYFGREGSDLLQYDPSTNTWTAITGGTIPADIRFVTASGGRLIAVTDAWVAYSSIDDGTDFAPSTVTGAGAQSLAIVGGGAPLGVLPTHDGFITYTKTGLLKSAIVQSVNPFRHVPMSGDHVPLSAYCITTLRDKLHVFLTKNGLYSTDGGLPQVWQPMMGEYLHRSVLPEFNLDAEPQIVRLTYNYDRNMFFISVAEQQVPSVYTKAYALYIPSEQWGSFDELHTGFITVNFSVGPRKGFNFGYINQLGELFRFTDEALRVRLPDVLDNTAYYMYHAPVSELQARTQLGVTYFPSIARFRHVDERDMTESGVYDIYAAKQDSLPLNPSITEEIASYVDAGVTTFVTFVQGVDGFQRIQAARVLAVERELAAYVQVGPFSVGDLQELPETMFAVTDLILGMNAASGQFVIDDYMLYEEETVVDYMAAGEDTFEDYGAGAGVLYTDYGIELTGSLDAYEAYAMQVDTPELQLEHGKMRKFSTGVNGMYHTLKISAAIPGHSFHLKTLTINGFVSGRL